MAKFDLNKLKTLNVDDLETAVDALRDLAEAAESLRDARDDLQNAETTDDQKDAREAVAGAKSGIENALNDLAAAGL